jgi:hypothetical protein
MTATLNPSDAASGIFLYSGNLQAGATVDTIIAVRSTQAQPSGKFYFEVLVNWGGAGGTNGCGIATASAPLTGTTIGTGAGSALVGTAGGIYVNGSYAGVTIESLASYPSGSTYIATRCVAVDLTNSKIWFRTNNGNWNANASYSPASNTGGIDISALFPTNPAFAYLTFQSAYTVATMDTADFGATSMAYPIPTGFAPGPSGTSSYAAAGEADGAASVQGISPAITVGTASGQASAFAMTLPRGGAIAVVGL